MGTAERCSFKDLAKLRSPKGGGKNTGSPSSAPNHAVAAAVLKDRDSVAVAEFVQWRFRASDSQLIAHGHSLPGANSVNVYSLLWR